MELIDDRQLIENIDSYHLDTVVVTGQIKVEFENVALYLDNIEDTKTALWLETVNKGIDLKEVANKEVTLKGIIDKNDKGHLNQFLGTIRIIEILEK